MRECRRSLISESEMVHGPLNLRDIDALVVDMDGVFWAGDRPLRSTMASVPSQLPGGARSEGVVVARRL